MVLPVLVSADFGAAAVGDTYSSSLRAGKVDFRIVGLLPDGVRRDPALGPLLDTDAARAAGTAGPAAVAPGSAASDRPLLVVDAVAMGVLVGHDTDFTAVLLYGSHLALPGLLGPALSLREFTGGPVAPALHTDYALTALLALGLAALVAAAVATETWLGRRRGLGAVLRLGETA